MARTKEFFKLIVFSVLVLAGQCQEPAHYNLTQGPLEHESGRL